MSDKIKYKSYLSSGGYIIRKDEYESSLIRKIKKDLTVRPISNMNYGKEPDSFRIYLESQTKLYLPKFYGLENLGEPEKVKYKDGVDINLKFTGDLREKQLEVQKVALEKYESQGGGILQLPTGFGKTVLALSLIAKLGKKTMVVVNREFLMNQWIDRINKFLPEARIGKIQQKYVDIEDKDIVIAMLQSLSMRSYNRGAFDSMQHIIVDEVHHISSQVFSQSLPKISSKYMVGLSATPNRADGLSKVFHWYIGNTIFAIKQNKTKGIKVDQVYFHSNSKNFEEIRLNHLPNKNLNVSAMINNICELDTRTEYTVNLIEELTKNKARNILVLSDRREHLKTMHKLCEEKDISVGLYLGRMKKKELEESETKQVLLATYMLVSEAFDLDKLNTLIMASPKKTIEQAVGRILRKKHTEVRPLIIDIVDQFACFKSQGYSRKKFFKKHDWEIDVVTVHDGIEKGRKNVFKALIESDEEEELNKESNTKGCVIEDIT